jgi:hypothetical protein
MSWTGFAGIGSYDGTTFTETAVSSYARQSFTFQDPTKSAVRGAGPVVTFTTDDVTGDTVNAVAFYADDSTTSTLLVYPFVGDVALSPTQPVTVNPHSIIVDYVDQTTADGLPLNLVAFGAISGVSGPGMVKIASGKVNTPVSFIDFELPAGYAAFELQLIDWTFTADAYITGITSNDYGATFNNDTTNNDTYYTLITRTRIIGTTVTTHTDAVFYVTDVAAQHHTVNCDINQGGANSPFVYYTYGTFIDYQTFLNTCSNSARFNPSSTVSAPTPGAAVNLIRLGDHATLTGGGGATTIASGSYVLWGIQP